MITVQNKKWKYLCLLAGICVFMISGCGFREPAQEEKPPVSEETKRPNREIIVPPNREEQDEGDTAPDEPEGEVSNETEQKPSEDRKPAAQGKPFWQSETAKRVQNLTETAAAAQADYKTNGAKRGWISKNGRLYGFYDGAFITPDMLVEEGYLESGSADASYELLLINGSDLAEYDGVNVPKDSMDFGVFAAVKQSGKYMLASPSGKVGAISEESYKNLLSRYNQNHGKIGRLSSASAEYERILNFISLYEGKFDSYYVREITKDNKYAVVTFSTTADTAAVKQYVLKNDNNFWEVVYPNVQMDSYPITYINRLVPDFNVNLLPDYNLASWKGYILSEQGGAVAALFSGRYISSVSEISYQCATANCAYFVLTDGSRYAAYRSGDYWQAKPVSSDNEAKNYFKEKTGSDYGFIILDD